jgi:hypothetical protein
MRAIPLTKGKEALVDDEDYDECMTLPWVAKLSNGRVWYAARTETDEDGRYDIYLHNFIMQPADGFRVDHIDRNGLNCIRSNMRLYSGWGQNMANRILPNSSGYKGVSVTPQGRYRAVIRKDGVLHNIGTFTTAEEAAEAYRQKAVELFGEYARFAG